MTKETTNKLYENYQLSDKAKSLSGYLYLKYPNHFIYYSKLLMGIPNLIKPEPELDESLSELIQLIVKQVGETAHSKETSIFHSKVLQKQDAEKIIKLEEDISYKPSEKVVPYSKARNVIINSPSVISAAPCHCRNATEDSCVDKERLSCIYIGEPHASFIAEQNPKGKYISKDEALSILDEAHKDGLVHTAYWMEAVGDSMYSICNCCSCHCASIMPWNMTNGMLPLFASSGYVAKVNGTCIGCMKCLKSCHFNALIFSEETDTCCVDVKKCLGCGICVDKCENGAKKMVREIEKGDPLDISNVDNIK